jgi:quercetin dioxygenase-like cupin family protein
MTGSWKPAEPGVKRRMVAGGKNMMAMEVSFEVGAEGTKHSHPHEQVSRLLKGRITFFLGDETYELIEGQMIVIPGNVVHGVRAHEESLLLDIFSPPREDLIKALS